MPRQQAIAASAPVMLRIANSRALWSMSSAWRVARSRKAAWYCTTRLSLQNRAVSVWVGVRVVLAAAPTAFTSLKSRA